VPARGPWATRPPARACRATPATHPPGAWRPGGPDNDEGLVADAAGVVSVGGTTIGCTIGASAGGLCVVTGFDVVTGLTVVTGFDGVTGLTVVTGFVVCVVTAGVGVFTTAVGCVLAGFFAGAWTAVFGVVVAPVVPVGPVEETAAVVPVAAPAGLAPPLPAGGVDGPRTPVGLLGGGITWTWVAKPELGAAATPSAAVSRPWPDPEPLKAPAMLSVIRTPIRTTVSGTRMRRTKALIASQP
jgi:hypothetical protein